MLKLFETYYPILFLLLFAGFLSAVFLGFSIFLGRRTKLGKKTSPYECGVDPVGSTKEPIKVKFFLVAILFILFDIEVIFLYPWAVASRPAVESFQVAQSAPAGIDAAVDNGESREQASGGENVPGRKIQAGKRHVLGPDQNR